MKFSNFKETGTYIPVNSVLPRRRGTVDVTSGFWPFRRTRTRCVAESGGFMWYFVDTGQFCPIGIERAVRATEGRA